MTTNNPFHRDNPAGFCREKILALALGLALPMLSAAARAADPAVSNVTFSLRAGTKLVGISYDMTAYGRWAGGTEQRS